MKVLIIEDEPFAQQEMKRLLNKCTPTLEVLAVLDSVEDAVSWFKNNEAPELIFADIELSDGSSFEIFKQVSIKAPVIFTTAYNEHALRAFKLNSIDYLLKPIDEDALQNAITKLVSLKSQFSDIKENQTSIEETAILAISQDRLESLLGMNKKTFKSRFMVSMANDRIGYVDTADIAYFYAHDSTCFLVTNDKRQYFINYNLEQLEQQLDPMNFFRITRKFITQIGAVVEVHRHFNSRLKVFLNPPVSDEVLISRVKVPEFLKWMDI